jgi:hypothetical protein
MRKLYHPRDNEPMGLIILPFASGVSDCDRTRLPAASKRRK